MRVHALVTTLLGAAFTAAQTPFYKAQFIFLRDETGKYLNPPRQVTLNKQGDLLKLVKFVPGVGLSKGGLKPGGWDAWGTIRLMRAKGAGIQLFFSVDGKLYSMAGK